MALAVSQVIMGPSVCSSLARLEKGIRGQAEGKARTNRVGARIGSLSALLVVTLAPCYIIIGVKKTYGTFIVCATCVFIAEEIDVATRKDYLSRFAGASNRDRKPVSVSQVSESLERHRKRVAYT